MYDDALTIENNTSDVSASYTLERLMNSTCLREQKNQCELSQQSNNLHMFSMKKKRERCLEEYMHTF